MTDPGMKCTRCRGPAQHRFPTHNVRFCRQCLEIFIHRQVEKAIKKYRMAPPGSRILVAVSGGKDSLTLWKVLTDLGFQTEGLHLSLDLGDFTDRSRMACQAMAQILERPLHVRNFKEMSGFAMQDIVRANHREFCSVCGTMKRYYMNRICHELGVETLASGHHLDDEAGRLLGNLLRNHTRYLENQWPVLEGIPGRLARKIKPMCRLAGDEIKAYARDLDLPAAWGDCPRARGATLSYYQHAVNYLDEKMPGSKRNFYFSFLRNKGGPPETPQEAGACQVCGGVTHAEICTPCRMLAKTRQWVGREPRPPKRVGRVPRLPKRVE